MLKQANQNLTNYYNVSFSLNLKSIKTDFVQWTTHKTLRQNVCSTTFFLYFKCPPLQGKHVWKTRHTYCCDDLYYCGSFLYQRKQDCYLSLHVLSFLCSKPIRVLTRRYQPDPKLVIIAEISLTLLSIALSLPSVFSISLTFIFTLIELNKKIMFDIKSLWTCGPADRCVCLFVHSKHFTLSGLCLLALLGCAVAVTAYLEFPVFICFVLTPRCCCAEVRLLSLNVFPKFCLVWAFACNSVCIHKVPR